MKFDEQIAFLLWVIDRGHSLTNHPLTLTLAAVDYGDVISIVSDLGGSPDYFIDRNADSPPVECRDFHCTSSQSLQVITEHCISQDWLA